MSGSLTTERAEEMHREMVEALVAIVKDDKQSVSDRLHAAQELDRQLGYILRPAPSYMPSSFPGQPM